DRHAVRCRTPGVIEAAGAAVGGHPGIGREARAGDEEEAAREAQQVDDAMNGPVVRLREWHGRPSAVGPGVISCRAVGPRDPLARCAGRRPVIRDPRATPGAAGGGVASGPGKSAFRPYAPSPPPPVSMVPPRLPA